MTNLFAIIVLLCIIICFGTWTVIAIPINELSFSNNVSTDTNGDILKSIDEHDPHHYQNNDKTDDVDTINHQLMRNKRGLHNRDKLFIRFGRDSGGIGYDRKSDKNFIRFGRNNEPMKSNGFIRFGRSDKSFIRLGRDDHSDPVRFGRRGDKFIRFGRSNGGNFLNDDNNGAAGSSSNNNNNFQQENGIEFDGFLDSNSLIKSPLLSSSSSSSSLSSALPLRSIRNQNFIRLGRPSDHNSFIRLGKKKSILIDNNDKIDDDLNDSIANELMGTSDSIDPSLAAISSDASSNSNINNNSNNNNNQRMTSPVEKLLVSIGSSGDKDSNYEENHQKLLKLFDPTDYL